ncbi:lipid A deacylase LpxR family protein [bacterium]|nr:lipid A deacylase LpxR family protein [bacterium]
MRARAALAAGILFAAIALVGVKPSSAKDADDDETPLSDGAEAADSAARDEQPISGFGLFVDQDFFVPPINQDRNYTMGVALQISGRWVERGHIEAPLEATDRFTGFWLLHDAQTMGRGRFGKSHSLTLGQISFTPDDLSAEGPVHQDRPYASLLYANIYRMTIYGDDLTYSSALTFGVLGLGAGGASQTFLHQQTRRFTGRDAPVDPEGWEHQISDGGEPTMRYSIGVTRLVTDSAYHDFAMMLDGNFGYYMNGAAGVGTRVGKLSSPFWQGPAVDDTQEGGNQFNWDENAPASRRRSSNSWEAYFSLSGKTRLVLYNAFLQGQFRESDVTFDASQIERIILEGQGAITLGYAGWNLTYAISARGREYSGPHARDHFWGGIYLTKGFVD